MCKWVKSHSVYTANKEEEDWSKDETEERVVEESAEEHICETHYVSKMVCSN